jgi:hypothetical protein
MTQGIQKQVRVLSAIEPERHLVQVSGQMLRADAMPRSKDAALEQRECGFHGVRVNVAHNVGVFVLDRFVAIFLASHREWVNRVFVGNQDFHVLTDVVGDDFVNRIRFYVLGMNEANITASLPKADHNIFLSYRATESGLSANIGFVHFDRTVKGCLFVLHCGTNAMTEVPRGFVANSDGALHLVRGKSLAGFAEEQGRYEPLVERKMGVVKDRTNRDAELVITDRAPKQLSVRFEPDNVVRLATRAFRAIGPAEPFEEFAALFVSIEEFQNIRESHSEHPN